MRQGHDVDTAPQSVPTAGYDAVVVGAGPYGLSTAARLLRLGLRVAIFGKTLEFWRMHMAKGMPLRAHWWAMNLPDPDRRYTFGRFLEDSKTYDRSYPTPTEAFIEYASRFQERAAVRVDETYVSSVGRNHDHFLLALEDGRTVRSAVVVMATGLRYYAHCPEPYDRLPAGLVSHSCEHNDFSPFTGQDVVVIGGGQSAVESATLLHEAGANVHLVSRKPIHWLQPARDRSVFERLLTPDAAVGPGWKCWVMDHLPYLLFRFPEELKDRVNRNYVTPAAAAWLKDRVIGKISLHEGHSVTAMQASDGHIDVTISDGEKVRVNHVILGTGYKADINKLTMIHPSLRAEIKIEKAVPILSPWFESSVHGLYFVGLTAVRDFGPLFRFVAGCGAAARRVANSVTRQRPRREAPGFRIPRHLA